MVSIWASSSRTPVHTLPPVACRVVSCSCRPAVYLRLSQSRRQDETLNLNPLFVNCCMICISGPIHSSIMKNSGLAVWVRVKLDRFKRQLLLKYTNTSRLLFSRERDNWRVSPFSCFLEEKRCLWHTDSTWKAFSAAVKGQQTKYYKLTGGILLVLAPRRFNRILFSAVFIIQFCRL